MTSGGVAMTSGCAAMTSGGAALTSRRTAMPRRSAGHGRFIRAPRMASAGDGAQ